MVWNVASGPRTANMGVERQLFKSEKLFFSKKVNSIRVAPHFDGLDDPFQMSYPQHRNSSYFFQKSQKYFSNFGLERCLMFGTLPRGKRKFLLTLKRKVGRVLKISVAHFQDLGEPLRMRY